MEPTIKRSVLGIGVDAIDYASAVEQIVSAGQQRSPMTVTALAVHAGMLPQAPPWMQKYGLEWLYRLGREPRRLWRRYAYRNPLFLALLASQRLGIYGARTDRGRPPDREVLFG